MLSAVSTRADDVANYPNVCSYPFLARMIPYFTFSPFKVSTRAFSRILIQHGSNLSMDLQTKRTYLLVLYLSRLETSMLSSLLMPVPRTQIIGRCTCHFRSNHDLLYQPCTLRGRSIYATRNRTQDVTAAVSQKLPPVPDNLSDISRLGLNLHTTFFGCDPKQNPAEFPLMIYIPNAPPSDGSDPVTK